MDEVVWEDNMVVFYQVGQLSSTTKEDEVVRENNMALVFTRWASFQESQTKWMKLLERIIWMLYLPGGPAFTIGY